MTRAEAKTILCGLGADSLDYAGLSPLGRKEMKAAIECLLDLPTVSGELRDYVEMLDRKHESVCAELTVTRDKLDVARGHIKLLEGHLATLDAILA